MAVTERTIHAHDRALREHAVERLLEWGFSREQIDDNLGHSKESGHESPDSARPDVPKTPNVHRTRTRIRQPKSEE